MSTRRMKQAVENRPGLQIYVKNRAEKSGLCDKLKPCIMTVERTCEV